MLNKVALLDLERYMPSAAMFRELLAQNAMLYIFHCQASSAQKFQYALTDLTEFAAWISCGQVVVLETPQTVIKEFEYALLVGQLLALVEVGTEVEIISAMPSSELLLNLMQEAEFDCSLSQVAPSEANTTDVAVDAALGLSAQVLGVLNTGYAVLLQQPRLQALYRQLPSLIRTLDQQPLQPLQPLSRWLARRLQRNLILQQKTTKQAAEVDFSAQPNSEQLEKSSLETHAVAEPVLGLYRNFAKVDHVQIEVLHRLNQLQADKPKDIYELRDLLSEMFPESDVRMLLKELLEKGYIYWNGNEIIYSHEMVLN